MEADRENAALALRHRLFVSGWELSGYLREVRDGKDDRSTVILHYEDGVPVGVGMRTMTIWKRYELMVFVRKSYRRRGIGTSLMNRLKKEEGTANASMGTWESERFWRTLDWVEYRE